MSDDGRKETSEVSSSSGDNNLIHQLEQELLLQRSLSPDTSGPTTSGEDQQEIITAGPSQEVNNYFEADESIQDQIPEENILAEPIIQQQPQQVAVQQQQQIQINQPAWNSLLSAYNSSSEDENEDEDTAVSSNQNNIFQDNIITASTSSSIIQNIGAVVLPQDGFVSESSSSVQHLPAVSESIPQEIIISESSGHVRENEDVVSDSVRPNDEIEEEAQVSESRRISQESNEQLTSSSSQRENLDLQEELTSSGQANDDFMDAASSSGAHTDMQGLVSGSMDSPQLLPDVSGSFDLPPLHDNVSAADVSGSLEMQPIQEDVSGSLQHDILEAFDVASSVSGSQDVPEMGFQRPDSPARPNVIRHSRPILESSTRPDSPSQRSRFELAQSSYQSPEAVPDQNVVPESVRREIHVIPQQVPDSEGLSQRIREHQELIPEPAGGMRAQQAINLSSILNQPMSSTQFPNLHQPMSSTQPRTHHPISTSQPPSTTHHSGYSVNQAHHTRSVGADSTTMEQVHSAEVSTSDNEVSTTQQRVESSSWGVSSSADISTSLLASRLSRDPLVSTSNTPTINYDTSLASSTTSGLRSLLSSEPRPLGVSSSNNSLFQHISGPSRPPQHTSVLQSTLSQPLQHHASASTMQQHGPQHTAPSQGQRSSSFSPPAQRTAEPLVIELGQGRTLASLSPQEPRRLSSSPTRRISHDSPPKRLSQEKTAEHDIDRKRHRNETSSAARMPEPGPSTSTSDDLSSSLVEQLRKAGVIITPVPQVPTQPRPPVLETEVVSNIGESAMSSPPRESEVVDTEFSKTEENTLSGGDNAQFGFDLTPGKRKRKPRKPIEINPELLRPKRPRRAKEKPESEEDKEKEKEVPKEPEPPKEKSKRGRKKKVVPENVEPENQGTSEPVPSISAPATPIQTPAKGGKKGAKSAKKLITSTPKIEQIKAQDEETRFSAEDSQTSREVSFRKGVVPVLEVCAETLTEYQWPLNDRLAESFMIQEQVTNYLGIKSFKRKYPDLKRRPVEPEEREYLQEYRLVSEAMCDLGLTAVPSAEVLDIMSADFHEKYEEYRRAQRDKQAREISGKQKAAQAALNAERGKQTDQITRAMQSAAKWNASLNKDRKEERRCCCDLQTMSVQFPNGRHKHMTRPVPKLGTYPVALIPGQFTDYYKSYTSTELKYMPLNSVLLGPPHPSDEPIEEEKVSDDESQSDSDESSSSEGSTASSSSDGTQDSDDSASSIGEPEQGPVSSNIPSGSKCKLCSSAATMSDSIVCASCNSTGHLLCLGLSADMMPHIRRYAWQCTDCKTCIQCKDPADEDKMLFCDMCDRGYHIYCVGLRKVPSGRWHCQECAVCGSCGSLDPAGTEASSPTTGTPDKQQPAQWQHEFKRGEKNTRIYAQTLCVPCSRLWRKGNYCQLCFRCFRKPDNISMLNCSVCDKWMHADCCSVSETSKMSGFVCDFCQEGSQVRTPITNHRSIKVGGGRP